MTSAVSRSGGAYWSGAAASGKFSVYSKIVVGHFMQELDMERATGMAAFEAKEFTNAWVLLKPFAERGDAEAQHRLAIMLQNGLGMVKNEALAQKWMRAAADQGFALAQHGLGFMYLYGECVEKNEAKAAEWFTKAADQGMVGSQMTLGMMYEQGLGLPKDTAEAKKWYALAEKSG